MSSRRMALQNINDSCEHPGLWLDRFLPTQVTQEQTIRSLHIKQASEISKNSSLYAQAFERWKKILLKKDVHLYEAQVLGRMIVGLGNESVLETSITLQHTYGFPYIPGSALKGLLAHYTLNELKSWNQDDEAFQYVFGTNTNSGNIIFYDAWYIPDSGREGRALHPDIMTVHHSEYYNSNNDTRKPPADWDSPNPISFLSSTGKYLIALGGDKNWCNLIIQIFQHAFQEYGIGAKTSSGYGQLSLIT